jgi:peptide chain release factor 2
VQVIEEQANQPDFWNSGEQAQKLMQELGKLNQKLESYRRIQTLLEDGEVLLQLSGEEAEAEEGGGLLEEAEQSLRQAEKILAQEELRLLFRGSYDEKNAILAIHPGAGGLEAQDWAEMLLRMYTRWSETRGYTVELLDYLPGEEAGVKSVTLLIQGEKAYGYLQAERGVHRLIRLSPFDTGGRRHTSFASVDVLPEVEEGVDVTVEPEELRIDTFRSQGAGGQHVNTTDSAVRITHIPTGLVVQCQNERSQHSNKDKAMRILLAKLADKAMREQREKISALRGEQKEIAWGSQIRTYVFHPYSLVKDHRTGMETGNVGAVIDGEIDLFLEAYLHYRSQQQGA